MHDQPLANVVCNVCIAGECFDNNEPGEVSKTIITPG